MVIKPIGRDEQMIPEERPQRRKKKTKTKSTKLPMFANLAKEFDLRGMRIKAYNYVPSSQTEDSGSVVSHVHASKSEF